MKYIITEPVWIGQDKINVIWNHPEMGAIPYTVVANSGEVVMQAIWDGLMRGDYGPIAPVAE